MQQERREHFSFLRTTNILICFFFAVIEMRLLWSATSAGIVLGSWVFGLLVGTSIVGKGASRGATIIYLN